MKYLKENGIVWNCKGEEVCTKALLLAGTMDLQAKAYLLEMTMHNGQHGCLTCEIPGIVVKQGRGLARIYPFVENTGTTQHQIKTRTTTGVLQNGLKAVETGKVEMGIKGVSPLFGMEWFNVVFGMVPDYMHGILLGISKKLLQLWFSPSNSSEPYFVGKDIKAVDKILSRMRSNDLILRLPRKLENHLSHLKASELQIWLLFYCIPCVKDVLPEVYLHHFALLVEGTYILLSDTISEHNLRRADYVFSEFYCRFADLYGEKNCTLNLHNAGNHLTTYVRKLGPLWAWSCFSFEDMNGSILQSVNGTGDVRLQILWIIQAQKRLSLCAPHIRNPDVGKLVQDLTSTITVRSVKTKHDAENCKIAGGMSAVTEEEIPTQKVCDLLKSQELGPLSKALRVVCGDTVFFSEEYTRIVKRIGHVVLTSDEKGLEIVTIRYFLLHRNSNRCMAVVKPLTIDESSPLIHPLVKHLIHVKECESEEKSVIWVENIREKLLFLNGSKQDLCVARLPNLFGLCN